MDGLQQLFAVMKALLPVCMYPALTIAMAGQFARLTLMFVADIFFYFSEFTERRQALCRPMGALQYFIK